MIQKEKGPVLLIYERFYVLLIVIAAAIGGAFFISKGLTPTYRAQARGFLPTNQDSFSLTAEQENLPSGPKLPVASADLQTSLLGVINSAELRAAVATQLPDRDSEFLKKNVDFAIDKFNSLVITAWDADPSMAVQVAETYMRTFSERLRNINQIEVNAKLDVLNEAIRKQETLLDEKETSRLTYMQNNQSVDYDSQLASIVARIDNLEAEITSVNVSLATVDERIREAENQLAAHTDYLKSDTTQIQNPRVAPLLEQFNRQKTELATLLLRYTSEHPEVVALQTQMQQVQLQLAEEQTETWVDASQTFSRDPLWTSFEQRLADLQVEKATLSVTLTVRQQQLTDAQTEWRALPTYKAGLDSLDQDIALVRNTLFQMLARRDEFEIYNARNPSYIQVTEAPVESRDPHLPNIPVNMLVAALLGLVVGVTLIVVMERLHFHREAAPW